MTGRWKRRGLVVGVNLVLVLCAAEATVRVAAHCSRGIRRLVFQRTVYSAGEIAACATTEGLLDASPWSFEPFAVSGGYVMNSRGFRTPEYSVTKPSGIRRVILLGDSFLVDVWGGAHDEDHVATRLAAEMKDSGRVEIVNLGVSCCGTHFQLRLLDLEGLRLHPDDVVLAFFVGNDLTDEPVAVPPASPVRRFLERWAVFRFARNLRRGLVGRAALHPVGARSAPPAGGGRFSGYRGPVPPQPAMTQEAHLALVAQQGRLYLDPWPGDLEADWKAVAGALERMRDKTARAGARFLVVLIPEETQIEEPLQDAVAVAWPERRLDFGRPQRIIAAFCREAGIPVLDLLPAFRRARAAGEPLYMPSDTHWNPKGQRLAASLIAGRLKAVGVSGGRVGR